MPFSETVTPDEAMRRAQADRQAVRWYVLRAYKKERLAEQLLSGADGLPHFIAKHYTLRTFHGRRQRVLSPAIPSLVFVHASRESIQAFKERHPLLQYVMWQKSTGPAFLVVPDKEMDAFIRVASQYEEDILYFSPDEIDLRKGMRVRIHGGAFDQVEGTLLKVKGKRRKRVVIKLEHVTAIAAAEIEPELIEVLK